MTETMTIIKRVTLAASNAQSAVAEHRGPEGGHLFAQETRVILDSV